jgi:hypothetical protein
MPATSRRRFSFALIPKTGRAYAYEVQIKSGAGNWQAAGLFTQTRRLVLTDLTPGTVYTVQARAIGGITGYSDWSDPSSHIAT